MQVDNMDGTPDASEQMTVVQDYHKLHDALVQTQYAGVPLQKIAPEGFHIRDGVY